MTNSSDISPPARTIRCVHCERHNPVDREFCGECGSKLREACLQCGKKHAVDEKFCGGCGTNLAESLQQRVANLEKKLALAVQMEREGRFYDAKSILQEVTANGDGRLEGLQENAVRLMQQLDQRKARRIEEAEHFEIVARREIEICRFDRALEALKAIPRGLRSREIESLFTVVQSRYQEVQSLQAEIKAGLASKERDGVLAKVTRFCELQPHHQDARQLKAKLAKQAAQKHASQAQKLAILAQRKIEAGQYGEAIDAVRKIEPEFCKGKIELISRKAAELHWYHEQLQRSPRADKQLVKIAQRWQKLAPSDPRPRQFVQELTTILGDAPRDRRFSGRPWRTRKRTSKQFDVQHWSGISRAVLEGEIAETIAQYPGQFFVAYGLALQGLGMARLDLDLRPRKNGWRRLLGKRTLDSVWGIDVGSTSLKALELTRHSKEEELSVTGVERIEFAKARSACNDEEFSEQVAQALAEFQVTVDAKKPTIALSLPGHMTLPRFFSLPPIRSKKTSLDEAVRFEIQHQIPLPLDESVYAYHAWDLKDDTFDEQRSIAAIAARKEDVESWILAATRSACHVALLQSDAFALYNALHFEILASLKEDSVLAVLDVGGDTSNILVAEKDFIWTRASFFGTKRLTTALSRDFQLTHAQSNRVRCEPTTAKWMHLVDQTLQTEFSELREEVLKTIRSYPRRSNSSVQVLLGSGGGCCQHGMLTALLDGPSAEAD